jgi:D-aminopeptidase
VVVKGSITRFAAAQVHPEEAHEMINAGAQAAVRRPGSVPRPDIELPARLDVELQTGGHGPPGELGERCRTERHTLGAGRRGRSA